METGIVLTREMQALLVAPAAFGISAYIVFATEHYEKRRNFMTFVFGGLRKDATWRQRTSLGMIATAIAITIYIRIFVVGR